MAPDTTVVLTRFHCPFVTKHPRAPLRDTGASGSWSSPRKQRVSRPPRRRTPWLQPSETTFGVWSSYLPKMHLCRFKSAPGIIAAARDWNTSNEKSRKVLGSSGKWATPRTPEPLLAREPPPDLPPAGRHPPGLRTQTPPHAGGSPGLSGAWVGYGPPSAREGRSPLSRQGSRPHRCTNKPR